MIIGRNFAESYYEDERLYSTGSDKLDELLERAFCEGYEYAQREFSKKKEKEEDDVKLKKGDSINYGINYGLMRKKGLAAKLEKDRLEGDTKKNARNAAIAGAAGGAIGGGIAGNMLGSLSGKKGGAAKGTALGSLAGAAVYGGASAAGSAIGTGIRHKIEKNPKNEKYRKSWEKQKDLFAVKQGEMTKKDFVKKWGGKINGEKIKGTEEKDKNKNKKNKK